MLKTFMQPGTSGSSRSDSPRTNPSTYSSGRTTESARPADSTKEEMKADVSASPARNDEGSKLIVGPNIKLKGAEITDCAILEVEGRVEASMNSRDIRIAEGGVFSGKAEIDVAEVHGTFEGELTARKRLVVYATGKVNGTIRYGALRVEEGGVISGNVGMHAADDLARRLPATDAQTAAAAAEESNDADAMRMHGGSAQVRSLAGKRPL